MKYEIRSRKSAWGEIVYFIFDIEENMSKFNNTPYEYFDTLDEAKYYLDYLLVSDFVYSVIKPSEQFYTLDEMNSIHEIYLNLVKKLSDVRKGLSMRYYIKNGVVKTLRLPGAYCKQLEEIAKRFNISFNRLIILILKDYLDNDIVDIDIEDLN